MTITADLELADLHRAGDFISRYEKRYGCAHQSLRWAVCQGCGRDFGTDEVWFRVLDAISSGTWDETGDEPLLCTCGPALSLRGGQHFTSCPEPLSRNRPSPALRGKVGQL